MRCIGLAVMVGMFGIDARAGEGPVPAAARVPEGEAAEGFASIFDGMSLDGWRGATAGYAVESGMLVAKKTSGGNLFTVKEYGDFILRFEYRLEPGGNNGVSIRGHEIQILDDDAPKHRGLKPCQYHGSIYCLVPARRGHTKPPGQWNFEEITVRGSRWKVAVNGTTIVDVDLASVPEAEALAKRTKGPLGLKGHSSRVEFRNLRIKEL
jgi:hypothetical protein